MSDKNMIALERSNQLKSEIEDYLQAKKSIPIGLNHKNEINQRKSHILDVLGGSEDDWNSYIWQLRNRIDDVDTLSNFIHLSSKEIEEIKEVEKEFRWAVSPYYLSLINPSNKMDPIRLMSIPTHLEIKDTNPELDPMAEEFTNPAGSITRRYPDRLIINVTNECPSYCRHCQRRRNIGLKDLATPKSVLQESIDYISNNEELRDILLTGGDSLTLSDKRIEWIITKLKEIDHVEMIRLGTRTLVTMPQRITDDFCEMIKQSHPIYINTHFNHPMEITNEAKLASEKLANNGVPLGNQTVLLNGINNDKYIMKLLNQQLLKIRIKPYYLFHCKHIKGTKHFNTSIDEGLEIMKFLRGYTSGLAIPTYIVNAPKGKGKTPLSPKYLLKNDKDSITIRTWENEIVEVEDEPAIDLKKALEEDSL